MDTLFGWFGSPSGGLGAKSSARDVLELYGEGKGEQWLSGKTAVVTGGNSGIGLETCKALASAGCKVVMCSRSVKAAEEAIESELMQPGEGKYVLTAEQRKLVSVEQLDLNNLANVKSFTGRLKAQNDIRLDYLILNAGIMALPERAETADGFEKQIGVNHFGHAFLVDQLYAKLIGDAKKSKEPLRVVVLTSNAHKFGGDIDCDDLHYGGEGRKYTAWGAYGQSKLANLLYARRLAEQFEKDGCGELCTALAVHPGVIKTNLWRSTAVSTNAVVSWISDLFLMKKNIPQGAATTLYAALAPEAFDMRGKYLVDCGDADESEATGTSKKESLRQGLWEATQKQLKEKAEQLE